MYNIRRAFKEDKGFIASCMVDASGGICEYLLSDLPKNIKAHTILSFEVGKNLHPLSFNNCIIAEFENKSIGLLCCYSSSQFISQLDAIKNIEKKIAMEPFYNINLTQDSLYIDTIAISENHQSKGVGRLLFESIGVYFNEKDYKFLSLYVWESNTKARKF